jgi:hypothetical protein
MGGGGGGMGGGGWFKSQVRFEKVPSPCMPNNRLVSAIDRYAAPVRSFHLRQLQK